MQKKLPKGNIENEPLKAIGLFEVMDNGEYLYFLVRICEGRIRTGDNIKINDVKLSVAKLFYDKDFHSYAEDREWEYR